MNTQTIIEVVEVSDRPQCMISVPNWDDRSNVEDHECNNGLGRTLPSRFNVVQDLVDQVALEVTRILPGFNV